jgi:nitrate/nitrite-specific signal transduction histidine kinase
VRNSLRHANATKVDVLVYYGRKSMHVTIAHDGCGIEECFMRNNGNRGHWGTVGIQERANALGTRVIFERLAPHGTSVSFVVKTA